MDTSNFQAWWDLDDVTDAHGANDLTNNNVVTFVPGLVGNAANFVGASSQYLSIADNAALSWGDIDATLGLFVNGVWSATTSIAGKWGDSGVEYLLFYDVSADRFRFAVSPDGSATTIVSADTLGAPADATWYFILCQHDSVNNLIGISVNNGTLDTAAHTTGVFNGARPFELGRNNGGGGSQYLTGLIDSAFVTKEILSADNKTFIYNAGAARAYSELAASFIPDPRLHGLNAGMMKLNGGSN